MKITQGKDVKRDFQLIEAYDMTFEATVTKLMWILGKGVSEYNEIRDEFYKKINNDLMFACKI